MMKSLLKFVVIGAVAALVAKTIKNRFLGRMTGGA